MDKKNMYLFKPEEINDILVGLSLKTKEVCGEKILLNHSDEEATCECCKNKITVSSLGSIAHGSTKFYCKDPVCFSQLVATKKLW